MRKNIASQVVTAQLVSSTDGSAVTAGTTTVYVTGDGGTQGSGSGTVTHEGNGCWSYVPTQAETNYNHIAFTFVNSSAVSVTVNVYTLSFDPHDTVRLGMTALPNAAADAAGGLPVSDAGGLDLDAKLANTNEITAARMGALTDWIDGGRLDLLLDAIKAVTDNLPDSGALSTLTGYVDDLETRLTATRAGYLDNLNGHTPQTGDVFSQLPANFASMAITGAGGVQLADGVTHGGTTAKLRLGSSNSTPALYVTNTDTGLSSHAVHIRAGNGTLGGVGMLVQSGGDVTAGFLMAHAGGIYAGAGNLATAASISNLPTNASIADAVWDEVITGAEHNINNSAAKFVREASQAVAYTGTAQAGTSTTITLEAGSPAINDYFVPDRIEIIDGTGAGQSRLLTDYDGGTLVATVNRAWDTTPDNTSVYAIVGAESDVRTIAGQLVSATAGVDFDDLAAILLDTNELQTDWEDGGRLDLILDAASSGSGDWTTTEKNEIRYRLGIDGTTSAPSSNSPNLGIAGAAGSGADSVTLTIIHEITGLPIADADVWISTDVNGSNVVAGTLQTNSSGEVTFMLDAGEAYYCWRQRDGINFDNPQSFTAVAD